ncbi:hypothetical protein D3C76_696140 [compost metagenome]
MVVVVVRLLLELGHDSARIFIGPVRQHHHVIAVVLERLRLFGIDHDRPVDTDLFLHARVTVIPVGAVLMHLEFVLVHAIGRDAVKAQTRYAIHIGRQDDPVPMDGGVLIQTVLHAQCDRIPFTPPQQRPRQSAIDGHGCTRRTGDVHGGFANEQVKFVTGENTRQTRAGHGPYRSAPQTKTAENATSGQAFDEGPPRGFGMHAVYIQSVKRETVRNTLSVVLIGLRRALRSSSRIQMSLARRRK